MEIALIDSDLRGTTIGDIYVENQNDNIRYAFIEGLTFGPGNSDYGDCLYAVTGEAGKTCSGQNILRCEGELNSVLLFGSIDASNGNRI